MVSVPSVSQVLVCFTCVILQTKSEENTEARESDMDFEGVFNRANCKQSSLPSEIPFISHSSTNLVIQSQILDMTCDDHRLVS